MQIESTDELSWSVVIPLYNKQDYIAATLKSVLTQEGAPSLEVIVVDDGSVDGSVNQVERFHDPRVRLIQQRNAGVSAARNRGIYEARGRWVVFLDADDLLNPHAIQAFTLLAAEYHDADAMGGGYLRVASEEMAAAEFEAHTTSPNHRRITNLPAVFLTEGMPFCTSSIAIRRDLFSRISPWFPVGEAMGEDLDLWFRIGEVTAWAATDQVIAHYRVALSDSLMGRYKDHLYLPVWVRMRARAERGQMPAALRKPSLRLAAEMQVTLARRLAKVGCTSEAWANLWHAKAAIAGIVGG
jgi:glycosyltransferase involved in cell wall biosynthesis